MMGIIRKIALSFAAFSLAVLGMSPFAQAGSAHAGKADRDQPKEKGGKLPKKDKKQAAKGKTSLEKKKQEWASGSR